MLEKSTKSRKDFSLPLKMQQGTSSVKSVWTSKLVLISVSFEETKIVSIMQLT